MAEKTFPIVELLKEDPRYKLEAYQFVREALQYAQEVLDMPQQGSSPVSGRVEHHLTGQQLCEAIRIFALEQYGYLAKLVLHSWGVRSTGDFGEIVYNLIRIKEMRKSKQDRREDFDDQFDFETAFEPRFQLASRS
jgi:uncharacterized repeat protein (TIGR04138 family)